MAATAAAEARQAMHWEGAPLTQLVQHLVGHHRRALVEARRIAGLYHEAASGRTALAPLYELGEAFSALANHLGIHMHKEEEILFEGINLLAAQGRLVPGSLARLAPTIRHLQQEHDEQWDAVLLLAERWARFTPAAAETPALAAFHLALDSYLADLHEHTRLEEEILLPRALRLAG